MSLATASVATPLEKRVADLETLVKQLSSERPSTFVSHLELPDEITLCDQKVPLDQPEVRQRIEFEFLLMLHDRAQVTIWQRRAHGIFPKFSKSLKARNVCEDLKYLALIESGLRPTALSSAKAKGYWQFIPETGKIYGLKAGSNWDERADLEKSTDAAITFLTELRERFGSWPLAMAAYNTGPTRLARSMAEQHVNDYWRLRLYREAERYVPRVIAAKIVMRDLEKWGFSQKVTEGWHPGATDYVRVQLKARERLNLVGVANGGGFDFRELTRLNPELSDEVLSGPLTVVIEVPKGKPTAFRTWVKKNIEQVPRPIRKKTTKRPSKRKGKTRKDHREYRVASGDTLWGISKKFGMSVSDLRKLNGLNKNSSLRVGDRLRVKKR